MQRLWAESDGLLSIDYVDPVRDGWLTSQVGQLRTEVPQAQGKVKQGQGRNWQRQGRQWPSEEEISPGKSSEWVGYR